MNHIYAGIKINHVLIRQLYMVHLTASNFTLNYFCINQEFLSGLVTIGNLLELFMIHGLVAGDNGKSLVR